MQTQQRQPKLWLPLLFAADLPRACPQHIKFGSVYRVVGGATACHDCAAKECLLQLFRYLTLPLTFLLTMGASASHLHRGPSSAKHKAATTAKQGRKTKDASAAKPRAIDDERATQIQTALVKAGYLQDVSGHWDSASQAAMQKLQGDNGWQTKLIPDSRALIKLGLGPNARLGAPQTSDRDSGAIGS